MNEQVDFVTEYRTDGTFFRKRLDRLTDGRVMCAICMEFTPRDRLAPVDGDPDGAVKDICMPCEDKEQKVLRWRESFAGRKTFRVLVTGSRTWVLPEPVSSILDTLLDYARVTGRLMIVVHGACRSGPDRTAKLWVARQNASSRGPSGVIDEPVAADWSRGRSAGPRRNEAMVDNGVDTCLAFIENESKGATHCANYAESKGVPTFRWLLSGGQVAAPPPGWLTRVPI